MTPHTSEVDRAEEARNRKQRRMGWIEDLLLLLIAALLLGIVTRLLW